MDILLDWLNNDVKLSQKIVNIEEQFANGYLFGELLYKYNQILNFKKFQNKDSKIYVVNNFTQIERVMRRLGINFSLHQAIKIKNQHPEIAVKLLRGLKDSLEKTEALVDIQIFQTTGTKNITFPLKKIDFSKQKYENIQNKIFYTRLYNTIPEQQELNLRKKNAKFLLMRQKILKHKDQERDKKQSEIKEKQTQVREILINQLKRKMNFAKEWNTICEEKHRENQKVTLNRLQFEKRFQKKKVQELQEKNERKFNLNQNKQVIDDIKEFEQKQKKLASSDQGITEKESINNYIIIGEKLKEIQKDISIIDLKKEIKKRENYFQQDFYKKERDRRLRKMIVDLKKDRLTNNFREMQQNLLNCISENSTTEAQLHDHFQTVKMYEEIFKENVKLNQSILWQLSQEYENYQQVIDEFEEKLKDHQLACFLDQQMINMNKMVEKMSIKDYNQIYQIMKEIPELLIMESFNYLDTKNELNKNNIIGERKQMLLLNLNLQQIQIKEKNQNQLLIDYLTNQGIWKRECQTENYFSKFFLTHIFQPYQQLLPKIEKQETANYDYMHLKMVILGTPYSEVEYVMFYLNKIFGFQDYLIQNHLNQLLNDEVDLQIENELKEKLERGEMIGQIDQIRLLINYIDHQYGKYKLSEYLKGKEIVEEQQEKINDKLADLNEEEDMFRTEKGGIQIQGGQWNSTFENKETQKIKRIKELKNDFIDKIEEEVSDEQVSEEQEEEDQQNSFNQKKTGAKFQSVIMENMPIQQTNFFQSQIINPNQKIESQKQQPREEDQKDESLKENFRGFITKDIQTVEQAFILEKETQSNDQKFWEDKEFKELFNQIYSSNLDIQKEKMKSFFDLVIILQNDPEQIFKRMHQQSLSDENQEKKEFIFQQLVIKERQIQELKKFYDKTMNDKSNILIFNVQKGFSETLQEIVNKAKSVIQDKENSFHQLINKNKQDEENFEKEKKLALEMEEQRMENKLINEEVIESHFQNLKFENNEGIITFYQKLIDYLTIGMQEYYSNIKINIFEFTTILYDFQKYISNVNDNIIDQLNFFEDFNNDLQAYIKEYNQFYSCNKEILEKEEIKNELLMRCYEMESKMEKKNLSIHNDVNNQISSLIKGSYFEKILILQNKKLISLIEIEIKRFLIEKKIIIDYNKLHSEQKEEEHIDKKKVKGKQEDVVQNFNEVNLEELEHYFKNEIHNYSNDQLEKIKTRYLDQLNECIYNQIFVISPPNPKNIKKEIIQSTDSEDLNQLKQSLQNKIKHILDNAFNRSSEMIKLIENFKTFNQNLILISKQNTDSLIEQLIQKLVIFIQNQQPIRFLMEIKDNQIQENLKKIYIENEVLKKQIPIEVIQEDKFSQQNLLILKKHLLNLTDSLGNMNRKNLLNVMCKNLIEGQGEIEFPLKFREKQPNEINKSLTYFEDFEDSNQIMFKPFYLYFLLLDKKVAQNNLISFYKEFCDQKPFWNKQQLSKIKLFFEYDDENNKIDDEQDILRNTFIKEELYQLFFNQDQGCFSFEEFIEQIQFFAEKWQDTENKLYQDLAFNQFN